MQIDAMLCALQELKTKTKKRKCKSITIELINILVSFSSVYSCNCLRIPILPFCRQYRADRGGWSQSKPSVLQLRRL